MEFTYSLWNFGAIFPNSKGLKVSFAQTSSNFIVEFESLEEEEGEEKVVVPSPLPALPRLPRRAEEEWGKVLLL